MSSRKIALTGLALAALTLTACSKQESSQKEQDLNWSVGGEITTMDPSKATDVVSFSQMINSMEGLYRNSKDGQSPGLATSAQVSKDGLTYTFNLRKSKWNDGTPVTAQDFVYSWRRTVNPKTEAEYSYLFSGIKNADAIQNGKKSVFSLEIKAEGKYKLVVTLEKRMAYFKDLMAFPVFFPQKEKDVKKYGNKQSVKLDQISFTVNKTATTAYNLYQSNKIDALGLDFNLAKQFKGKKNYYSLSNGGPTTWNLTKRTRTWPTATSARPSPRPSTGRT